ncbi:MAG: EAL domain-containing protein, partial [Lachnospiraceae bacterium]|nr:EAL domain-containing protein [Lachnospiraceae bacterium]
EKLSTSSKSLHIRFRTGIYASADHSLPMEERFSYARFACNTLRGNFLRSIAYYDVSLRERSIFVEHVVNDIHEGLEQKQFLVYYQPKYLISGEEPKICSAEALVRWQHPKYGMIRPKSFLSVLEENGLIGLLDRYVIRETIEQLGRWRRDTGADFPVSVNVSRIDLYDMRFSDFLMGLLDENGLKPKDLYLEITESAYSSDTRQLIEAVEGLRQDGFRIEMDDFGSGYSSLNSLSSMPVDVLKLDMNFIRTIHEDTKVRRMVRLIMELAEFMEIPVVAEGVEIAGQYDVLREIGCEYIQGNFFSKPLPAIDFEKYFLQEAEG